MSTEPLTLFRPTGQIELGLVLDSELRSWPPRLVDQPIFYPVLNRGYAAEIASQWNTKSELRVGYVTAFDVEGTYAAQFERRVVGARSHEELWVPADQLITFNDNIIGRIRVIDAFFGEDFVGYVPESGLLAGLSGEQQETRLLEASDAELSRVVAENRRAVFLHVLHWTPSRVVEKLRRAWSAAYPDLPLPVRVEPQ